MRRASYDERAFSLALSVFPLYFLQAIVCETNPVNGFDFAVAFDFDRDAIEISGQLKPSLVQESL